MKTKAMFWGCVLYFIFNKCAPVAPPIDYSKREDIKQAHEYYKSKKFAISTSHNFPVALSYVKQGKGKQIESGEQSFRKGLVSSLNKQFRQLTSIIVTPDSILYADLKGLEISDVLKIDDSSAIDSATTSRLKDFHQKTGIDILMYPTEAQLDMYYEVSGNLLELTKVTKKFPAYLKFILLDCSSGQIHKYTGWAENLGVDAPSKYGGLLTYSYEDYIAKISERCVSNVKMQLYEDLFKITVR